MDARIDSQFTSSCTTTVGDQFGEMLMHENIIHEEFNFIRDTTTVHYIIT